MSILGNNRGYLRQHHVGSVQTNKTCQPCCLKMGSCCLKMGNCCLKMSNCCLSKNRNKTYKSITYIYLLLFEATEATFFHLIYA